MRFIILVLLLFTSFPAMAQNGPSAVIVTGDKPVLVRDIRLEGFVLGDKDRFIKIFKPYRNKYLSASDMDEILKKIQLIYEREGYQQLVSITYKVIKHRLVFTALMIS